MKTSAIAAEVATLGQWMKKKRTKKEFPKKELRREKKNIIKPYYNIHFIK